MIFTAPTAVSKGTAIIYTSYYGRDSTVLYLRFIARPIGDSLPIIVVPIPSMNVTFGKREERQNIISVASQVKYLSYGKKYYHSEPNGSIKEKPPRDLICHSSSNLVERASSEFGDVSISPQLQDFIHDNYPGWSIWLGLIDGYYDYHMIVEYSSRLRNSLYYIPATTNVDDSGISYGDAPRVVEPIQRNLSVIFGSNSDNAVRPMLLQSIYFNALSIGYSWGDPTGPTLNCDMIANLKGKLQINTILRKKNLDEIELVTI